MSVLSVSVTERGRELATRLPFEHRHGDAAATVRARWADVNGFVLFLAAGAATRIAAPLLSDKRRDPAVVCVDDGGRFAVALCGGHAGGANELARRVGALLGAEPVITTATDATGTLALDSLPGFVARGDVAGVAAAMLDGRAPAVDNPRGWPLPSGLRVDAGGSARVVVTDLAARHEPGVALLHPPSLVVGVGASRGAPEAEVEALLGDALGEAGLAPESVAVIATLDRKAAEPAIIALTTGAAALATFTADELGSVDVPNPSAVVASAVGTPSVAEAAALRAAGVGGELLVGKRRSAHATVAVARRRPRGHLAVVGLGPGTPALRTPAAENAIRRAQVVVGYERYIELCDDVIGAGHDVLASAIGDERLRAKQAVAEAAAGRGVALVCSGDAGVYGMASLAFEVAAENAPDLAIEVVPGITAALAAAAVLGAPLAHDHAAISLSDLLTPWAVIERRLRAVAEADLVVSLYNPRSAGRTWQFDAARAIFAAHRSSTTPVGVVTDAGRAGQHVRLTTLAELDAREVGMTTCVVIGSTTTRCLGGRMVTPRGYAQ